MLCRLVDLSSSPMQRLVLKIALDGQVERKLGTLHRGRCSLMLEMLRARSSSGLMRTSVQVDVRSDAV